MVSRTNHKVKALISTKFGEEQHVMRYFDSWWMFGAVLSVSFLTLLVGAALIPAIGVIFAIYSGYRANQKPVPSQAIGAGCYYLAILYIFHLQPGSVIGALLVRFLLNRYAFWKHPQSTFRRPIGDSDGYYYNPAKVGLSDRILIWIVTAMARSIPFVGRLVARRLLIWIVGLEIEASELSEDDIMYYLHEDSPGNVFEGRQSEEERVSN